MANLKLSRVYKVYDNGHKAVNDFNIDIEDREFIVFVGPSGCGKSTTLRMIAGLEDITAGDIFIGENLVNDMEPKDRDIAMVFQNYALYPHMTVYDNMAFGLRNRKIPEKEIKAKVLEAAKILDIEEYLDRKPKAMSGGQRQRVALGRAIVRDPKVFLLDEPLSNLDAKLRAQMRTEITKLHKKLQTTFIYVTHDQVEAMTMGTRIVVMKLGYVQQIDTPMNLYNKPYNKFVAGFIGTPQMNFFNVTLTRSGNDVLITFPDGSVAPIDYETVAKVHGAYMTGEKPVILGVRPDHISIVKEDSPLKMVVTAVEHLGSESIIYGQLGEVEDEFTMKDDGKKIIVKTVEGLDINVGDIANLEIHQEKIHLFDTESEITLLEDIPQFNYAKATREGDTLKLFGAKVALPEFFKDKFEDGEVVYEIPPMAIVPGNDFKLKVAKIEEFGDKRLAHLAFEDHYIFALVDETVKVGSTYKFSLLNEKVKVLVNDEVVVEPLGTTERLIGTFNLKTIGRNLYEFHYNVEGNEILAPIEKAHKLNTVEGNSCYKKEYAYVIDRDKLVVSAIPEETVEEDSETVEEVVETTVEENVTVNPETGEETTEEAVEETVEEVVEFPTSTIRATVDRILDYGNQKYAVLKVNEQEITVTVPEDFAEEEVNVTISGSDIQVWQIESDFLIC